MEGELYKLFPHVGQEGTVVPSKDVGYIKFETPVFVKDFRFRFAFHDVYILLKIISYIYKIWNAIFSNKLNF